MAYTPGSQIINDVTQLNPIQVAKVITPQSTQDIQQAVKQAEGPICIGGGRYSMGGQTACENALHIDMRQMNQILRLDVEHKLITIQAGCTWRRIQEYIDPFDLSIKIMQTYANFTVGGSLSVNSHGRYIGLGPLVLSVVCIKIVVANGDIIEASPTENSEVFYAAIGGYGGIGVIAEATLQLVDNIRVSRHSIVLSIDDYLSYFQKNVKSTEHAIFHNADLYPPQYNKVRLVTWYQTFEPVTVTQKLIPLDQKYPLQKYFIWAVSETHTGKWRRQLYVDPLFYLLKKVVWRNYEASYDVKELEPNSRKHSTYVLQEYFVPINEVAIFTKKIANILRRYRVNVLNISIRHALQDPGTYLAWAQSEVFAFVLYYKERINELDKNITPIWTRELIEAALSCHGRYYLPYQPHATMNQFLRAYPQAPLYFKIKKQYDPDYKFRNKLWENYYRQEEAKMNDTVNPSEFKEVFLNTESRDAFFLFLQNVYNIYPENPFHLLIYKLTQQYNTDKEIYEAIQKELPSIKVFLNDIRYAVPALLNQKKEITTQTLSLVSNQQSIDGYVEIGSNGRYISDLKRSYDISNIYFINDTDQTYSPVDIVERGSIEKYGQFVPFNNYQAIGNQAIKSASVDLVTCYIGLHHCPLDRLESFVNSIHRILRPGGALIIRDHDVTTPQMRAFVSLAHTVFNAGLGISWQENIRELRHFNSIEHWLSTLEKLGFKHVGRMQLQDCDPTLNTLFRVDKV
ncbi:MAG: FAD-binding protein [Candidatus Berkiella sp.]